MSGHVAFDQETGFLQITFPYSPSLVELVKRLPNRRWDRIQKVWLAPANQADEVIRLLSPRGFTFSPEVKEKAGAGTEGPAPGTSPETALTVSQLNHSAQAAIKRSFSSPIWLVAELDRCQVRGNGFCYLELIEKDGESDGIAASLSAMVFPDNLRAIQDKLTAAGNLKMENGMEVKILVQPDIYPKSGRFQAQIRDIDPTFTLGKLAARREEILREISRLGLQEKNRALPWPRLPLRVALITSWDSNACHDFTGVLCNSGFGFQVDVCHANVQGDRLEGDVTRALDWFGKQGSAYDVLAIVRGGGSPADLAWFDNLQVALRVARHPLKTVIGIGHTQDQGVLDQIAHSARTPTAAAEEIVGRVEGETMAFARTVEKLLAGAKETLSDHRSALAISARRLGLALAGRLREERAHLTQLTRQTASQTTNLLRSEYTALADLARQIPRRALALTDREGERLEQRGKQLKALHPNRILARGFALVRDQKGRIIRSVANTKPADNIEVELADGRFPAKVTLQNDQEKN